MMVGVRLLVRRAATVGAVGMAANTWIPLVTGGAKERETALPIGSAIVPPLSAMVEAGRSTPSASKSPVWMVYRNLTAVVPDPAP